MHNTRVRPPNTYLVDSVTQARRRGSARVPGSPLNPCAAIQGSPATVVFGEDSRHALEDGDEVLFEGMVGMEQLHAGGPRAVRVTGTHSFTIADDISAAAPLAGGGYCHEAPRRGAATFRSMREELAEPSLVASGQCSVKRARSLHASFRAPRAPGARPDLCPVTSIVGAFASAEALKALTRVHQPLGQWLYLDFSKQAGVLAWPPADAAAALGALRVLLVGAGGVGGEALKNLALLGVGQAQLGGCVTLVDDDLVARPNLARGLLLRASDVGHPKAQAVAARGAALRAQRAPAVHAICARLTSDAAGCAGAVPHAAAARVVQHELLDDSWVERFGVVLSAVDCATSRAALDERCVRSRVALLDAGVDGALAHCQPVVPFASVPLSHGAREPPAREPLACVLNNFPSQPWHAVAWARARFDALFGARPADVNAYLGSREYLDALRKRPVLERLAALRSLSDALLRDRPYSLQDCLAWARAQFEALFAAAPRALLAAFPADAVAPSGGGPFWHGAKRLPAPAAFHPDDPLHLRFVAAAANLQARVYGLNGCSDLDFFRRALAALPPPQPSPPVGAVPEMGDAEAAISAAACEEALAALPAPSSLAGYRLAPLTYDADADEPARFIAAASAMRARCFRIPEPGARTAQLAAGSVLGALQPTAALAGGLLALQLAALAAHPPAAGAPPPPLSAFRCCYASLAASLLVQAQPTPAPSQRAGALAWTLWDRLELDARGTTLEEALAALQLRLGLRPSMVSYGKSLLFADFLAPAKRAERLALTLPALVESVCKAALAPAVTHLALAVSVCDAEDEDVDVPGVWAHVR